MWLKTPHRRLVRCGVVAAVILLVMVASGWWWISGDVKRGTKLIYQERYAEARRVINRYLWLHPRNAAARIKLAEAYVKDPLLDPQESAGAAISVLQDVDSDDPLVSRARLQEARLRFLILRQPTTAEKLLREVLKHSPDSHPANYLMWKILDQTRRYHLVEPYFNQCFASSKKNHRERLLVEWYFSQFSTFTAGSQLDQMMGFAEQGQSSDTLTEYRRLSHFVEAEPDSALNHAILADWYRERGMELEKWASFEKAWDRVNNATSSDVYAFLFDLLLDAGRFEEAKQVMQSWPEPRAGFDYWKRRGLYLAEIEGKPHAAISPCQKAINIWPGPVDWQLHHRLAGLLTQAKRNEKAETVRAEGKRMEKLMEVEFHRRLRKNLFEAPSKARYQELSQFYSDIDRPMEAKAWLEVGALQSMMRTPQGF